MSLSERTDAFLFAPVNRRVVDLFRVALTLMVARVYWPRPSRLQALMPDIHGIGDFNLLPWWFGLIALALALFAIGWRTRWMAAGLAILLIPSLLAPGYTHSRQILYVALLATSLLRSDFCFGLFRRATATPGQDYGPIWPIRLVQLQLSLLYFVNAAAKTTPEYLSGDVLIGMSRFYPNFKVDLSSGFLEVGPLAIPVWLCALGTVAVEFLLALGFWFRRTRILTALLGVTFHGSLRFIIQIGWLDWASVFLYLSFLLPFEDRSGVDGAEPGSKRDSPVTGRH